MHPGRRSILLLPAALLLDGCAGMPPQSSGPAPDGVTLLRPRRGATPIVSAHGQARIEDGAAHDAHTRFLVGSITKWVTAVAMLRLMEEARLGIEHPVTDYLPELPPESGAVLLRHLLSNTSGIPNGLAQALREDRAATEGLQLTPLQGALRFGARPPAFTPGTRFDYSFTNWVILGAVIERVTKEPFTQAIERLVLRPAGMKDSGFADAGFASMPQAALAYDRTKQKRKMSALPPMVAASGTLYSTAADLLALADAVFAGDLLSRPARRMLLTVQHAPEDYALGGRVRTAGRRARTVAWESGVIGGYKTLLVVDPADGAAVVLLNNTDVSQDEQAALARSLFETFDA